MSSDPRCSFISSSERYLWEGGEGVSGRALGVREGVIVTSQLAPVQCLIGGLIGACRIYVCFGIEILVQKDPQVGHRGVDRLNHAVPRPLFSYNSRRFN
jgi:hypothetical protein